MWDVCQLNVTLVTPLNSFFWGKKDFWVSHYIIVSFFLHCWIHVCAHPFFLLDCNFLQSELYCFFNLFLCFVSSLVSCFPSSDHLFQGQLFSRLTREWYRRLLPRSISSKWSKGEFTLLTSLCTVAVLTFNCLSVFRANSHLVPDNCGIPGLPGLAWRSLGYHLKLPLIA